jgi:methylated-DNA-[protein]-cysteine S-methyltransferase
MRLAAVMSRPPAIVRLMGMLYSTTSSPLGELLLAGDDTHLRGLYLPDHRGAPPIGADWRRDDDRFSEEHAQLAEYFAGERVRFDLSLAADGTEFEQRVWAALREIPYGETRSYGELATGLGQPGAARAVGAANGRNRIAIVVPCHRVIGANGSLTGFAAGLDNKRALLEHEAGVLAFA